MSVAAEPRAAAPRGRAKLADREALLAPLFLLPAVVYIIALVGIPLLLALAFAFSDVTVGDPSFDWVGLRNFEGIFDDPVLR
jgi:multiple sugar transport system permease protein